MDNYDEKNGEQVVDPPPGKRNKLARYFIIVIITGLVFGCGSAAYLVQASNNPAFCSTCHIMQPYYQSWQESSLLANKHAAAGVTCHDCHESSFSIQAEEGIKYITGNYKDPLDKRVFTEDFCLKCHSDSGTGTPKGDSLETVKAKTNFEASNPHDSHNGEQECNLCHNMHQQSKPMCAECHSFSWFKDLDAGWTVK